MNYSLFYNLKLIGDILLIILDEEIIPNRKEKMDEDVVFIYHDDNLVGINIFNFSKLIKVKSTGLIPLPNDQFIDVINSRLKKFNFILPYKKESGFKIGKIIELEEHPESSHLHLLKVDIGSEVLDIVCGASNVSIGAVVVVATIGTTMFDGSLIKKGKLLGYESYGMCCSERELNLTNDQNKRGLLILDDTYKLGEDFFQVYKK